MSEAVAPAQTDEQPDAHADARSRAQAVLPVPTLHQADGPAVGTVHRLVGSSALIGRRPSNDIVLDAPSVSRVHARIARFGSSLVLTDLSSTTGTRIGSREVVGSQVVRHGDRVSIGPVVLVLHDPAAMGVIEEVTQVALAPGEIPPPSLSPRQAEIVTLMGEGCSNKEIATCLGLTHRTIKSHASEIYARLGVANRAGAVASALSHGLI